jgi:uncharacterized protein with HEPN domain
MSIEIILSLFEDIKHAIRIINRRFSRIKIPHDFMKDDDGLTNYDAISMRLRIIGEALKKVDKLDKNFLDKYPQIEWYKIKRMRDFISHHYNEMDEVEVYSVCKTDIPQLEEVVDKIIKDINAEGII